ncbi:MAG: hypothetical protein JNN25_09745 [Candidatus Kapabacteria bacterium]|nr:hypothetical protein [Candidatus Kapabacteria bacterium]
MKNNVVKILHIFVLVALCAVAPSFAQKPEIRPVGVDANGIEIPQPLTIEVAKNFETRVYALPASITFQENSTALPQWVSQITKASASSFAMERLSELLTISSEVLNIIGKRMATAPAETLTLSESDPALKRAASVSEYLRTVWGISATRITTKVNKQLPKNCNCVETSATALLKPVVIADTPATATPAIIRFYSTVPSSEESSSQWAIALKQDGKALRSPISAAGRVKPAVDWKINKEKNTIPMTNSPLKVNLEVRYPTLPNQRSETVEIPVRVAKQIQSYRYETLLPFQPTETTLNASHNAVLALIREKGWLQAASKVTVQCFGAVPPETPTGAPTKEFGEKQRVLIAQRLKAIEKAFGGDLQKSAYKTEIAPNLTGYTPEPRNCIIIRIENPVP